MSRNTSRNIRRGSSGISRFGLIAGLLSLGLGAQAFAQSVPFPTYSPGQNLSGSQGPSYSNPTPNPWVVSDGKNITPAGTQVYLGTVVRAKAVALNPLGNHTAAVLIMGSSSKTVAVFNTQTGAVLQTYEPSVGGKDANGSATGITYTPNGKYLLISQDGGGSGGSGEVDIASVNPQRGCSQTSRMSPLRSTPPLRPCLHSVR